MSWEAKIICTGIAGFIGAVLIAVGITYTFNRVECSNVEKNSSAVTTEWRGITAGCYVTENGKTFPLDRWKVQDAN